MSARATATLSEILQMQSYSRVFEYAQKGYLVDLSKAPVLAKVIDSAKPSVTWDGKQWALPMDFAGIGIVYNKDIFAKYKLQPPTTYRELERVAKTLKDNGITPFAGLLKENWSIGTLHHARPHDLLAEKKIAAPKFVADMNAGQTSSAWWTRAGCSPSSISTRPTWTTMPRRWPTPSRPPHSLRARMR